jgi:hypothetical protein
MNKLFVSMVLAVTILGTYCSQTEDEKKAHLNTLRVLGAYDSDTKNEFDPIYTKCKHDFSYPCGELAEAYAKAFDASMIKSCYNTIVEELSAAKDSYAKPVLEKQHQEFVDKYPNSDKPYSEQLSAEDKKELDTIRHAMLSSLHYTKVNSAAKKMSEIFDK